MSLVVYAGPAMHEVAFLENLWREQARRARHASLARVLWRHLPNELIRLIADRAWGDDDPRVVSVQRMIQKGDDSTYKIEERCWNTECQQLEESRRRPLR